MVYGDVGTSPLYVFTDVFSKVPITSEIDVLVALSVILYTITLVPLAKYVFVVLKANDNGEGTRFSNFLSDLFVLSIVISCLQMIGNYWLQEGHWHYIHL